MSNNGRREKLDIIFKLETEKDSEEIIVGTNKIVRIKEANGIDDVYALRIIINTMQTLNMPLEFNMGGKQFSAGACVAQLEHDGKWSKSIEASGLVFQFGRITAMKHCFVSIVELEAGSAGDWQNWVKPFAKENGFVQAWISDVDYDHWQNVKDPLEYEEAGRDHSHLPKKSNGLPPPLEQLEIDTSNNPGRWLLKPGYVEAVGATMWIGNSFWSLADFNRKELIHSAEWLKIVAVNNDVIQLNAAPECFRDESTKDIQDKLRAALYS